MMTLMESENIFVAALFILEDHSPMWARARPPADVYHIFYN